MRKYYLLHKPQNDVLEIDSGFLITSFCTIVKMEEIGYKHYDSLFWSSSDSSSLTKDD